jgi:hypothetical protein
MSSDQASETDYTAILQRHAALYSVLPPIYYYQERPYRWECYYLGSSAIAIHPQYVQNDVAYLMYQIVTVNRPMPL